MATVPVYPVETGLVGSSHAASSVERAKQKRILLLIRCLFLTLYASMGSLQPFLPIYYHSLGHEGLTIGVLGAIRPLVTFLVSPLWGVIADRTNNRFLILKIAFFGWVTSQLSMPFRDDAASLMGIVFLTSVFQAPIKSLIDSLVMDQLTPDDHYGRLRLFGQLGYGLGTSSIGLVLSRAGTNNPEVFSQEQERMSMVGVIAKNLGAIWAGFVKVNTHPKTPDPPAKAFFPLIQTAKQFLKGIDVNGYRLAFFAFSVLSTLSWLCVYSIERVSKKNQHTRNQIQKTKKQTRVKDCVLMILQDSHALLFLFLVFVVGVSTGCTENFAYVRMKEAGATSKDIGFSRLMGSAAGATMFWFAGNLAQNIGPVSVLVLTPLSYATRFFVYAMMTNPYHALPAELLRGVAFAAFWSTATTYACRISPHGMSTTMLMLLNAMYQGLGPSLGAIVFGKLQSEYGTSDTFAFMGMCNVCLVFLVALCLTVKDASFLTRVVSKVGNSSDTFSEKAKAQ